MSLLLLRLPLACWIVCLMWHQVIWGISKELYLSNWVDVETLFLIWYWSTISMGTGQHRFSSPLQKHEPVASAISELELGICGEACRCLKQWTDWSPRLLISAPQIGAPGSWPIGSRQWSCDQTQENMLDLFLWKSCNDAVTSSLTSRSPGSSTTTCGQEQEWYDDTSITASTINTAISFTD